MSLRCASRVVYQAGMRVMQGMKDQASKCDSSTAVIKSLKDTSKQGRRFSGAGGIDSTGGFQAVDRSQEKLKQAEESLRTVMYLSCWAPN